MSGGLFRRSIPADEAYHPIASRFVTETDYMLHDLETDPETI